MNKKLKKSINKELSINSYSNTLFYIDKYYKLEFRIKKINKIFKNNQ